MSKLPPAIVDRFRAGELIAAIAQDAESKEVLMMAWMNEESLAKTIETKRATYWSRSRNSLWVKGETSGHYQDLVSLSFDCDSDCLLLSVKQTGAACHTGERTCFHTEIKLA
jgi:phosphoribosyl-AMP cyclohydrolase